MADDKGAILIELDAMPPARPEAAAAVPDAADGAAMARAIRLAARPRSALGGWFWTVAGGLFTFVLGLAAWDYVNALLARSPFLGAVATALLVAFLLVLLAVALRELAAFARIARLDRLQQAASAARAGSDLAGARTVLRQLDALYATRPDMAWGRARMAERQAEVFDADGLLGLAETTLLAPLDRAAEAEVQAAARQVAAVTALVPIALADVVGALTANLRMIRRIAEIYGGRGGVLGAWRLTRAVMTHLVATGLVAVGDDMIGSAVGGGLLAKVSRRFGEGVVNAALTARVGVAAIEVCRPLPFVMGQRPGVSALMGRALQGLFATGDASGERP